jgi:hypothetical protein
MNFQEMQFFRKKLQKITSYQSQEIISHLSSVKAADKSLKKEGASIEKYNPFISKRFIESFWPHLNMKLFPGIGITFQLRNSPLISKEIYFIHLKTLDERISLGLILVLFKA